MQPLLPSSCSSCKPACQTDAVGKKPHKMLHSNTSDCKLTKRALGADAPVEFLERCWVVLCFFNYFFFCTWLVLQQQDSREVTITGEAQQDTTKSKVTARETLWSLPPSDARISHTSQSLKVPRSHILHLLLNARFKALLHLCHALLPQTTCNFTHPFTLRPPSLPYVVFLQISLQRFANASVVCHHDVVIRYDSPGIRST